MSYVFFQHFSLNSIHLNFYRFQKKLDTKLTNSHLDRKVLDKGLTYAFIITFAHA